MRIYYAMEAEGLRHHVRSALGVDAGAWNRLNRQIHDWRRSLESRYGIPADLGLRPGELTSVHQSCACGCHSQHAPRQGAEVIAEGLRLIEDFAVESGGIGVTNICLDKDDIPAYRLPGQGRYTRIPAGQPGPAVQPDQRHRRPGWHSRLRHLRPRTRRDGLQPLPPAQELQPGAHAPRGLRRRLANPQRTHRENHWRPGLPGHRRRLPAPGGRPRGPRPPVAGEAARPRTGRRRFHQFLRFFGPRPEPPGRQA